MDVTVTEWRVVGLDHEHPDTTLKTYDQMPWTRSLNKVYLDLEDLHAADPPFDEIWVEERTVTMTTPKRVPFHRPQACDCGKTARQKCVGMQSLGQCPAPKPFPPGHILSVS